MIRTLDFNPFPAGTVIDDEYEGVNISATGGSGEAMIFDSANPTGDDGDLASDTLGGLLIISEDGDSDDPDDNASGGTLVFDFDNDVQMKSITFKDIEAPGATMNFYDRDGNLIESQFVEPTGDGGEATIQLFVPGTAQFEVVLPGSGAIDNVTFDDPGFTGGDDGPTAVDDLAETPEDTPVTIDLLGNDTDGNGQPLTLDAVSVPEEQGEVTDNGDGTVTFMPAPDFNGPATISYTVSDPDGNTDEGTATVNVTPVNDAPDAVDDADTTDFNTPNTVDLLANDEDVDGDPITVIEATVPEEQGTLVNNGDGTVTFTPADGFTGDATISYTIDDPAGLTDSAVHVVTVSDPADGSPTAVDDTAETPEDTMVVIDLLGNDTDPTGQPLTLDEVSVPEEQGEVTDNGDGTVTFMPAPDFNGPATITYVVSDPDGNTDTGEAVVNVTPVNDAPDAVDDADTTDFNTPITVELLANDSDVDGDPIFLEDATVPAEQGTLADNGDGTVTFTPALGFVGTATISYTISDPDGLADSAIHEVTVLSPTPDGIVTGTDDGEVIDEDFLGDPNGDIVNDDPAILPGTDPLDDSVQAGGGDDTITTGDGADTVDGGDGDDLIDTGSGEILPDSGYPFADTDDLGYLPDSDTENDRDSVDGGDGDDTISTGDDRDTISGGEGADVIDGGIDDDLITGDGGNDRIVGSEGSDTIEGGEGDDTIFGGTDPDVIPDLVNIPDDPTDDNPLTPDRNTENGRDLLDGGAGDDLIFGADDDDTLLGGSGDDTLDGGIDDDLMDGGTGDDLLDGGQGDDTMLGGDGQDTFINVNAGDDVDGGDGGPIDFDTLDLTGSLPEGGSYVIDFTSPDREDGVVNYFDADGNDAGQLVFEEIENIIPCFTPGTKIATPKGERLVETLEVGDRVITRDNGIQEIRWVGARDMTGAELERASHLKPVLIRQGALGNDLPERDMMVSPNHRVLVANDKTALYFEEREVLVAAKHLTGLDGVDIVDVSQTTYVHIMFDQHEVILSDGTWTESFQPGDQTLAGIGNAQRQEILELFPELATKEGIEGYASARRSLKKHEAKLLTE